MEWMDLLLGSTQAALPAAAPEELEQLVGALAYAKYQPCEEWAQALFSAMQPHLSSVGVYNPKVSPLIRALLSESPSMVALIYPGRS